MEAHSIRKFIDELFPKKEVEKRAQWAKFFIDQEYEDIEQLKKLTEDQWNAASKAVPMKIINDIKEKLSKDDGKLSFQEKKLLCRYMENGSTQSQIMKFFGENQNSPKGLAIVNQILALIKPPKPYPTGCKRVSVKLQEQTLPLFLYNGRKLSTVKYYTLLVVGQTGSGKSTLLDAFVNKLTGMNFTDNWRWKLVDEDHLQGVHANQSQTTDIKTYYVNDVNGRFNIRIIDTPGFGDTKGIQADDDTVNKFESLFKTIIEIDYILLTVKASETKLRAGSKYVYTRVQQVFGNDAKDRFILMCTFGDGKIPLCIQTFKNENIFYQKYFPFNNSVIYVPSVSSNSTTAFFWKMCMDSIKNFQDQIIMADRCPLNLKLSQEVLQSRKYLQQSISTSQVAFTKTCSELDIAKQNLKNWKQNKKQIEENGQFTKIQNRPQFKTKKLGKSVQMCMNCKITCCQICEWKNGQPYSQCTYFNDGKGCPKCPGKCGRTSHAKTDQYITMQMVTHEIVIDCKKAAYDQGVDLVNFYQKQLNRNVQQIRTLCIQVMDHSNQIKENLRKLQAIALQPKLWTDEDFYKEMIKEEEEKKADGWTDRVKYLQEVLARMKTLQKLEKNPTIDDMFPDLKYLKNDLENTDPSIKTKSCEIY